MRLPVPVVAALLTFAPFVVVAPVACAGAEAGDDDDDDDDGDDDDGGEGEGEGEEIGPGAVGDDCIFNADCGAGLRCGCEDGFCTCEEGARGTGVNGVDTCVDENDCASAVCAEDSEGTFTCSGPCEDDADCEARMPICSDIAFIGKICVRDPGA